MTSNKNWLIVFAIGLLFSSLALFSLHYIVFHDLHQIAFYTLQDLAFLPIEALLVTLILHQLLERQARKSKLNKLNMVIGLFFSEIGVPLMRFFSTRDLDFKQKNVFYLSLETWSHSMYASKKKEALKAPYKIQFFSNDLISVRDMLIKKEDFLVRLLENPLLLEHESFTEVLLAVFHLTDELKHRGSCADLPESDMYHLSGDITRIYSRIIPVWLSYLEYLKADYPYLFSLAIRTNPFVGTEDSVVR
ncbi:MAG TPA: hypothetical protein VN429_03435, partial [Methanospirillum sp.]|uniref:hypothetical protein n=1 Tax=Methanospirillum sp. TaxID=45200 RepID=UPI002CD57178